MIYRISYTFKQKTYDLYSLKKITGQGLVTLPCNSDNELLFYICSSLYNARDVILIESEENSFEDSLELNKRQSFTNNKVFLSIATRKILNGFSADSNTLNFHRFSQSLKEKLNT
ncbi:hypothetical protein HBN50_16145 [Halobacteriovorax sp. GB3]|uniref:hypothetical protein n=1 Tax=Halobacteriovorax sp. GB3 TaxID=2719615 RepID=UPI00235E2815|nr:hypothetical protein [Halobacteriovorax sp. GB3]MDD0854645.1 hypothetical protein [Halobacteriovorax sp. GB3]